MENKRVVITGIGTVTAVGLDPESFWDSIQQGKHGISVLEGFDTSALGVTVAAQVKNFDPLQYIEKKELRRTDRYAQFALAAATQAIDDCGTRFDDLDPYRLGVIYGSGIGGFTTTETEHTKFLEKGPNRVSVYYIPMMISNMAAGLIAMKYQFKGTNYAPVSACATSSHALGEAFRQIKHGYLDVCLTGGSEASISEFAMGGFNNMKALTHETDPDKASLPFDARRSGFVMGEGGGAVILEELEHAKARGAKIYAEVVGYGATSDAYHITSPIPDGSGAAKAMELAYSEAGLQPNQVDYINAHGTATGLNDKFETAAIKLAFGDHAYQLKVSSTKSMTGHLLGAAGIIEAIVCAKTVQEGFIPATIGYEVPDPDCDLNYVANEPIKSDVKVALSNSLGFGGHNASICIRKYDAE